MLELDIVDQHDRLIQHHQRRQDITRERQPAVGACAVVDVAELGVSVRDQDLTAVKLIIAAGRTQFCNFANGHDYSSFLVKSYLVGSGQWHLALPIAVRACPTRPISPTGQTARAILVGSDQWLVVSGGKGCAL